jgi:hypothetical protein
MPFRFSEFAARGKTGNPWADTDRAAASSRPATANSYDFRHYQPQPPVPIPIRNHPVSIVYDNGTGLLDPRLVQDHGLPATVQTTDQLAEFLRHRNPAHLQVPSPTEASQYSDSEDLLYAGHSHSSFEHPSLHRQQFRYTTYTMPTSVAGYRGRSASPVISRVLPGTTRKHQYEGFWLSRRALRKSKADLKACTRWWKRAKEERPSSSNDGTYVETSGWYD